MILLDKPLISDFVKDSIRAGMFAALDTGNMIMPGELDLMSDEEAIRVIRSAGGTNLHTTSENALKWVYDNLEFTGLPEKINLFKDKYAFRELLSDVYPDFFYKKVSVSGLDEVDAGSLPKPFIIKPVVGFFSMGVHKVFDDEDWKQVRAKISDEVQSIRKIYPDEVLNPESYIIEQNIDGDEYAFDAYFDDRGDAHILGVMEHPFGGEQDVSDRVYNTSVDIVGKHFSKFEHFLKLLGDRTGLQNFSLHTEVRINEDGMLIPIEVNPLRFGAWCTSADLMHYAFGINPYSLYINKEVPIWEKILSEADDRIYSIIILDNSSGIPGEKIRDFNYSAVEDQLSKVLELRKIDYKKYPIFGILFTKTEPEEYYKIKHILHDDLKKYIFS